MLSIYTRLAKTSVGVKYDGFDFVGGVRLRQEHCSLESQVVVGKGQPMAETQIRFTKANNGVITDSVTGLDWYVGSNQDNNWHQAKDWTENLTVAGGGMLVSAPGPYRLPAMPCKNLCNIAVLVEVISGPAGFYLAGGSQHLQPLPGLHIH